MWLSSTGLGLLFNGFKGPIIYLGTINIKLTNKINSYWKPLNWYLHKITKYYLNVNSYLKLCYVNLMNASKNVVKKNRFTQKSSLLVK